MGTHLEEVNQQLDAVLKAVGWTPEKTFTNVTPKPPKTNKKQKAKDDEPDYPESINDDRTVVIDPVQLFSEPRKIPQSHSESILNFTREERLRMYDYVIGHSVQLKVPELKINFGDDQKLLSFAQIMQIQKQQKRKRLKYRVAKLPPTSYTEEIRSLIEMQMAAFVEYIRGPSSSSSSQPQERNDVQRVDCERKEKVRSQSRDRRNRSRDDYKRKYHRSHSRDRSRKRDHSRNRFNRRSRSRSRKYR